MKNFSGPFSKDLTEHILLKQSIGYNYNTEECILVQFDNFTKEMYPDAKSLTKEITVEWCSKRSYESKGNQASRVSALRQFTLYLDRIGKSVVEKERVVEYDDARRVALQIQYFRLYSLAGAHGLHEIVVP